MSDAKRIVVEADTMEEALSKAEEMLKEPRTKLRIETLSGGSKGLLGFGKKKVVIRASLNGLSDLEKFIRGSFEEKELTPNVTSIEKEEGPTAEEELNKEVLSKVKVLTTDGYLEIRNREVIITEPQGLGEYPCLVPGQNVTVKVNGKEIDQPTVIRTNDRVELIALDIPSMLTFQVLLSDDKLHAHLSIQRLSGKRFVIMDSMTAHRVTVETSLVVEEAATITYDALKQEMDRQGVVYGINDKAIEEALSFQGESFNIEIATGINPSGAEDGQVVYSFLEEKLEAPRNPYGEGKIQCVEIGQVMATKKPPVEGVPGTDVTGRQIPCPAPKDVQILIKDGVELVEDDSLALASIVGRPILEGQGKKYLSVRPVYYVNGDVDLKVGNISFKDDIVVSGSVLEGFRLEAGGSIEIFGDVDRASINALGDVDIYGKAFTTTIQAGGPSSFHQHVHDILQVLQNRISDLVHGIAVLRQQDSFASLDLKQKGDGQLIQLLIDFKFKDIPRTVEKLEETAVRGQGVSSPDLIELRQLLSSTFLNLGPLRIKAATELEEIVKLIECEVSALDLSLLKSANVMVSYAQNSKIHAAGNINITGEGAITTEFEAGGRINIAGVVRGGTLTSRDKITVKEIGSAADAQTRVRLLGNCRLEANLAHPGLVIYYGAEKEEVLEDCRSLKAYVKENRLFLETG